MILALRPLQLLSYRQKSFFSIPVLVALVAGGCTQKLPNYPPAYREYAYVTNGKSNTVTVLDMREYKPVATIPVGNNPSGVAANSQKNEVYVVNAGSNSLSVIDAEQNKVVATIGMEHTPFFVDVSSDGTRAYVANSHSNSVSIIDTPQRRVLRNVPVGKGPGEARVSQDGKSIVVTERLGDSVSVIDAKAMIVRSSIPICKGPTDVQILPDSGKAFVTCSGSGQVAVIGLNMSSPEVCVRGDARLSPSSAANTKSITSAKVTTGISSLEERLRPSARPIQARARR